MDITAEQVIKTQERLEQKRKDYEQLKTLCVQFAYPHRSDCWDLFGLDLGKVHTKTRKIYDPTAIAALEIRQNGILGQYMPRGINWFQETMADPRLKEDKTLRKWLQDNDDHLRYVLDSSGTGDGNGYYDQKSIMLGDGMAIGDAGMFIEEDRETGKQMFMCPHPRTLWFMRDFWGRIIGIHYKFKKTLKQVKDEFGEKALDDSQNAKVKNSPDEEIECLYAIYKNEDYDPRKIGVMSMRWRYVYINTDKKKIMESSGTDTLNPVCWSNKRPSHWDYGMGDVAAVLVEIITANFQSKDMLNASQQAVSPAMLMAKSLKNKLDLRPSAVNFIENKANTAMRMGDLFARLIDPSGYPFGVENHQRWQDMINRRFGVPLFMAMNSNQGPERTAFEVSRMEGEQIVLMAPFLATLGNTTDLELDRIYAIEVETRRAPPIPDQILEAGNGRIDTQFIGPLMQKLKQYYEYGSLATTISAMQAVASMYPYSLVVGDGDTLMRKVMRSVNTDEEIILDKDEVQEIRAIAAQQQEAQQMAQMMADTSKVVPNLSKKVEADSVLGEMTKGAA